MKNFKDYKSDKYDSPKYEKIENNIYKTDGDTYVTSLMFEFELDMYEEDEGNPQYIPQVPMEGLLDMFYVYISDFYDDLNKKSKLICYQEFASSKLENIKNLRQIINRRVYALPYIDADDGEEYYNMVIEPELEV